MNNLSKEQVEARVALLKEKIDMALREIGAEGAKYSVSADRNDGGPYFRSLPTFNPYTGKIRVKVRQADGALKTFYLGPKQEIALFSAQLVAGTIAECQRDRDESNERERQRASNFREEQLFINSLPEDDRKFCRLTGRWLIELRFAVPCDRVAEALTLLRDKGLVES